MTRSVFAGLVSLSMFAVQGVAAAQDVDIHIRIAPDVADTIAQIVRTDVVPDIQREIRDAVIGVVPRLPDLAMLVGANAAAIQDREFRFEQTRRETKTLTLGPSGALDLDTLGGDITVTVGTGRDTIVEIVRISRGRTEADAVAGLDQFAVNVEQRGTRASVSSRYQQQDRRSAYRVHANYNVTAPAGTTMTIKSLGGNIRVKGIRGDLSADTAGGNIEISGAGRVSHVKTLGGNLTLTEVTSDEAIVAETFGGNVNIQALKARRLSASTTGGDVIARDVACESADLSSLGGSVEYAGTLARSGRYTLHSTGGNIRFYPTGNVGFELDASTFAGEIRSDLPLQTTGSASQGRGMQRTLHGTSGDGSAIVKATTMSGNVVIGRKQ
jgi:DUF4097 and DUF4098 domain-containing protein YvlB